MAIDRTATYQSSTIGYSRPLTDNLQINLDFTQAHINGTIASYNVNGTPDMGDEFYYSVQLVGTSLFMKNDMYTAAFRYSDLRIRQLRRQFQRSIPCHREPLGAAATGWRLYPSKNTAYSEYTVLPSLLMSYVLSKDWNFEIEAGERWTWRAQGTTRSDETEFVITAGFRLDFYGDPQNCLIPSVFCATSSQASKQ